jgi:hypothetical protein
MVRFFRTWFRTGARYGGLFGARLGLRLIPIWSSDQPFDRYQPSAAIGCFAACDSFAGRRPFALLGAQR